MLELDLPTMQWETSDVPAEVESLKLESAWSDATVVEDQATAIVFIRTVSGGLVAFRQIYEGSIGNQNAIRREWSIHGHPPSTRLAAPPVSDHSGRADIGLYAPSVDGRLWNRHLGPTVCKDAHDCVNKPKKTWVYEDLGHPPAGPITCSPAAAVGTGYVFTTMRDGSLAAIHRKHKGSWKSSVDSHPHSIHSLSLSLVA